MDYAAFEIEYPIMKAISVWKKTLIMEDIQPNKSILRNRSRKLLDFLILIRKINDVKKAFQKGFRQASESFS